MRNSNPTENTGQIIQGDGDVFLGSCFIFRYPSFALTADHVVNDRDPGKLFVRFPGSRAGDRLFAVKHVFSHPNADLAVIEIEAPPERDITWPVYQVFNDFSYGVDIVSFGYPASFDGTGLTPTPRFFKGYVQRFYNHTSHLGYNYVAAEINFSCPAGLSGSQVLNEQLHGRLYGVVTENLRTSSEIESVTEVNDDGKEYKESYHNIISYGIVLWLPDCADWLDEIVPIVSQDEIQRRSKNQHKWNAEETPPNQDD